MAWINIYILSFLTVAVCASESSKGDKRQQLGFKPVHFAAVGLPLGDTPANEGDPKTGAFKIDDGNVVGAGTYEIQPDGVDVDISLKISTNQQGTPGTVVPGGPGAGGNPPAGGGPAAGEGPGAGGGPAGGGGPGAGGGPAGGGGPGAGGGLAAGGGPGAGEGPGAGGGSKPALCPVPCSQTRPTQGPRGGETGGVTTPIPPTTGAGGGGTPGVPTQGVTFPPGQVTTPAAGTTGPTTGAGAATTSPTGGGGGSQDEVLALNKHNEYRRTHGVPPMKLNAEMSQQAAAYAQKIAQQGALNHASASERNNDGENLSMGCDSDGQTTAEATTNWYNEVCVPGYTFGQSSGSGGTGHFTQVVWKESVELGIGKADIEKDGMKCTYIVGRYRPAGNMMGTYAENVPQGSFNKAQACSSVKRTISHYWAPRSRIHHRKGSGVTHHHRKTE